MPKISVVIPLFNKENFIKETLDSVLKQTFIDFEVIVVNDGSTDNSFEIASQFIDNRIRLYNEKNKGVSQTRNIGIEYAYGELIAFLDADDVWFPNHLEELYQLYIDFPNCGIYCNRYQIKKTSKHIQKLNFNGIDGTYRGIVSNYFYSNKPYRIAWTSALMVEKRILKKLGGFNINVEVVEDIELWTKIALLYPVAISNKVTAQYNFNIPNSLTKRKICEMKLFDFSQFERAEQSNSYLKEFLDLHRFFYAIQYKSIGDKENALFYYSKIAPKNLSVTNKFLFKLPSFILQLLYKFKHLMNKIGLQFSTYN